MHKPRRHFFETPKKVTSSNNFRLSQSKSTKKPRTTDPLHRRKQISLLKAHDPLPLNPLPPTTPPLHLHPRHHHPLHPHHPLIPSQIYPNQLHPLNQKQPYQPPSQKTIDFKPTHHRNPLNCCRYPGKRYRKTKEEERASSF